MMQSISTDPRTDGDLPRPLSFVVDETGAVHLAGHEATDDPPSAEEPRRDGGGDHSGGDHSGGDDSGKRGRRGKPSNIPPRRSIRILRWVRRVTQGVFLALFLFLLFQTTFRGSVDAAPGETTELSWPVEVFFYFDPLAALLTFLSTLTVYSGLLWALVTVALTLVFGRVFCGWICPMGTLNQIVG
ncbi:MAG: 4Fe-4S binding protein, partial [Myxococcota bacterium]